jgi:cyclohexanone monooxygenase
VESMEYSYSFSDELQQEWDWPERYGTQPEILKYINHVADRFDLRRDIEFNTRVTEAVFDSKISTWTVTTDKGHTATARFCIMATGNLSTPRKPNYPGLESFKGKCYHTGLWPHEGVDFTGWRVGVIGTGSSGVQSIPIIAKQAKHLYVFQRTANFSLPARNAPLDPAKERAHKNEYPERRRAAFDTPFGIAGYPAPVKSALAAAEEERLGAYEAKWAEGGSISFLYSFTDLLLNKESNETAAEFVRRKIRATVKDPRTAELLCPDDHPIGTKRLILDTDYYETYNRDNVSLVDIRSKPIKEITPTGLRTADAEYALDAIVFATGFDAMTGAMKEIDIHTDAGMSIREKWEDGPRTYLGIMIAGFPNLFMITGPQSPGVKSQMILACEQHVDWIADCLQYMRSRALSCIEAEEQAEGAWVQHNNEVADRTLYPLANSWYVGANIPGKPRVFMPYVGGVTAYKQKCDDVAAQGYEGFRFGGGGEAQRFAAN